MRYLLALLFCGCTIHSAFLDHRVIVQLHHANVMLSNSTSMCSGVLVGETKVLTASHCTKDCTEASIRVAYDGGHLFGKPTKCDVKHDIALIELDGRLQGTRFLASKPAVSGDPIYVVANPVFQTAISDFTTFGIVAAVSSDSGMMMTSTISRGGSSGGAIYGMDGGIVGIITGVPLDTHGAMVPEFSIATTLLPIRELMR